jgi:phosphate transport system substrate-binding protein
MKPDEASKAPSALTHIPTALGAVAISYNLPGVSAALKLTPEVLADVYLGSITRWNDARIANLNAGTSLPDTPISPVYRSDGSGTTAVFTDFLSKVSSAWKGSAGSGKSVKWPVGLGAKGNEGIAGQVKTTPGSIGYVELAYSIQSRIPVAALRNTAGEFVTPEIRAITAAAAGVQMPESLHASITNSGAKGAYPIASYTYLLVYQNADDPQKAAALANFLWWAIHEGQDMTQALHYAPLPSDVVKKVEARLRELRANGKPLLAGT